LPRRGQSPSRCVEDAQPKRFGQARQRPLIHFRAQCQWTAVDNSTLRRKRRDYPRSRCASSRKRSALSLMNPAASCWS
jgi:hypothetical protein